MNKLLIQLYYRLAGLYLDEGSIRRIVSEAGYMR